MEWGWRTLKDIEISSDTQVSSGLGWGCVLGCDGVTCETLDIGRGILEPR